MGKACQNCGSGSYRAGSSRGNSGSYRIGRAYGNNQPTMKPVSPRDMFGQTEQKYELPARRIRPYIAPLEIAAYTALAGPIPLTVLNYREGQLSSNPTIYLDRAYQQVKGKEAYQPNFVYSQAA